MGNGICAVCNQPPGSTEPGHPSLRGRHEYQLPTLRWNGNRQIWRRGGHASDAVVKLIWVHIQVHRLKTGSLALAFASSRTRHTYLNVYSVHATAPGRIEDCSVCFAKQDLESLGAPHSEKYFSSGFGDSSCSTVRCVIQHRETMSIQNSKSTSRCIHTSLCIERSILAVCLHFRTHAYASDYSKSIDERVSKYDRHD